jgi:hypothetical protein
MEPVEAVVIDDTPGTIRPGAEDRLVTRRRLDEGKVQRTIAQAKEVFGGNFPYRQDVTAMLLAEIAEARAAAGGTSQNLTASQFTEFALRPNATPDELAFFQKLIGMRRLEHDINGLGLAPVESRSANLWWTTRITPQDAGLVDGKGAYDPHWLFDVLDAMGGLN